MATKLSIYDYCKPANIQENHLKAFLQFSGSTMDKLRYRSYDFGLLVDYEGETYMVSSRDDFKNSYRYYFERESYSEIYTDTPEELWEHFFNNVLDIEPNELMRKILRSWNHYWDGQRKEVEGGKERYETMRNESFKQLEKYFITLGITKTITIKNALEIDDTELIPIMAMTIYNQYQDSEKDNFYEKCIDFLISRGEDLITDGDTFTCIYLDAMKKDAKQRFYIYNPMFAYDDV